MNHEQAMLPPHSREAEESVLGSLLIEYEAIYDVIDIITPQDFYVYGNGLIYDAMLKITRRNAIIDSMLVKEQLEADGKLEDAGGLPYIFGLVSVVQTSLNAAYYAKIVADKAKRRRIIRAAERMANLAHDTEQELADVVSQSQATVADAFGGSENGRMVNIDTAVSNAIDKIEARARGEFSDCVTLPWKIMQSVRLEAGEVMTIAARPAMGKTSLWLQIGMAQAQAGREVIMFSLEMSAESLMTRVLSFMASVPMERLKNGELHDYEWQRIYNARAELQGLKLSIYDGGAGIETVINEVTRATVKRGGGVVIMVDYIGLLDAQGFRGGETYALATHVSKSMKRLARDTNSYVINNSQLSRQVESRQDKRPMLSDLRDTGAIEQDSDIVIFIYRDEYYFPDTTERPGVAEILVRKYRNGQVGTYDLAWLGERTMFADLARTEVHL